MVVYMEGKFRRTMAVTLALIVLYMAVFLWRAGSRLSHKDSLIRETSQRLRRDEQQHVAIFSDNSSYSEQQHVAIFSDSSSYPEPQHVAILSDSSSYSEELRPLTTREKPERTAAPVQFDKTRREYWTTPVQDNKARREYWADPEGSFLERVAGYQRQLSSIRESILKHRPEQRSPGDLPTFDPDNLTTVIGYEDDYLKQVARRPEITTLYLKWAGFERGNPWRSRKDVTNVLLQTYHAWTISEPLCAMFKNQSATKARWHIVYNYTCAHVIADTGPPANLEVSVLHGKPIYPMGFYPESHQLAAWKLRVTPEFVTYVHVIDDAVVDARGVAYSGNLHLAQDTCAVIDYSKLPQRNVLNASMPLYDEVLVVYQYWGEHFFHKLLESVPKISPYLDFLHRHQNIKIYFPEPLSRISKQLLDILNITHDRAFNGSFRARTVYFPRSTPCGFPLVQEVQLFSKILRDHITARLNPGKRNRLIIVQRSYDRQFLKHIEITNVLMDLAKKYGLNYTVWLDHPVKGFEVGMRIFHEAVLIVAPHGGGESNVIFSQPGTFLVEGVCNEPHVNMCYQRTAYILGHHYHGVLAKDGCPDYIDVDVEEVKQAVTQHLEIWRSQVKS